MTRTALKGCKMSLINHWRQASLLMILFFFVFSTLFYPAQMVEASFPLYAQPDLKTSLDRLTSQWRVTQADKVTKKHPAEIFSRKLHFLKQQVKATAVHDPTDMGFNLMLAALAATIPELLEAEKSLNTWFKNLEDDLVQKQVSQIILDRHKNTSMEHRENFRHLACQLKEYEMAYHGNPGHQNQLKPVFPVKLIHILTKLSQGIDVLVPDAPYNSLDIDRLPRREAKSVNRGPLKTKDEFRRFVSGHAGSGITNQQAEIPKRIQALTDRLDRNPNKIFKWVRNQIRFVPTYGFKKSAVTCLESRSGNAFDIANLLVQMLRASGREARFALGTIEIDEWWFRKALGDFQVLQPALRLARHGGIPVESVDESTVLMEHIWVETRSNVHALWQPMDAALKPALLKHSNLSDQTKHIAGSLLDKIFKAAVEKTSDNTALENTEPSLFPGKLVLTGTRFSLPPLSLQHKIGFKIIEYGNKQPVMPNSKFSEMELSEKSVTITYEPASKLDWKFINDCGSLEQTPSFLIQLRPVVKIDGKIVFSAASVTGGTPQEFQVWFFDPHQSPDYADHILTAGQTAVLGFDCQQNGQLFNIISRPDQMGSRTLEKIALTYLNKTDLYARRIAAKKQIAGLKTSEEVMVSIKIGFSTGMVGINLIPVGNRITVDVQRSLHAAASFIDNNSEWMFHKEASEKGSLAESESIESFTYYPAISTAKLLKKYRNIPGQMELDAKLWRSLNYSLHPAKSLFGIKRFNKDIYELKIIIPHSVGIPLIEHFYSISNIENGITNYMINGMGGGFQDLEENRQQDLEVTGRVWLSKIKNFFGDAQRRFNQSFSLGILSELASSLLKAFSPPFNFGGEFKEFVGKITDRDIMGLCLLGVIVSVICIWVPVPHAGLIGSIISLFADFLSICMFCNKGQYYQAIAAGALILILGVVMPLAMAWFERLSHPVANVANLFLISYILKSTQ